MSDVQVLADVYGPDSNPINLMDLCELVLDADRNASPKPWKQEYAFNGGGCPIADFHVPSSQVDATVQMMSVDAALIVAYREAAPILAQALKQRMEKRASQEIALINLMNENGAGPAEMLGAFIKRLGRELDMYKRENAGLHNRIESLNGALDLLRNNNGV